MTTFHKWLAICSLGFAALASACSGSTVGGGDTGGDGDSARTDGGNGDGVTNDVVHMDTITTDTGTADTGTSDTGASDTGTSDTSAVDVGTMDTVTTDTGSADTGTADTGTTDTGATDTGPADTGSTGCAPALSACTTSSGSNGLCESATCSPCTDMTDDAACQAAYGSSTSHFLCISGACVPANCRTDADCTTGQICGLYAANQCGGCTSDAQCHADTTYGAGFICNTTLAECVTSACANPNHACTANASDFCCPSTGIADTCVPGNCCVAADCGGTGSVCSMHTCTTCALVTGANPTYIVDPMSGSDTSGTGSGMLTAGGSSTGCDFQSITRALAFIGATPAAHTTILVRNTATVGALEHFPIIVPANVFIEGAAGAVPLVQVPAGQTGFVLQAAASGLQYLTIDGSTNSANNGIESTTGSTDGTTISNVTVQNFGLDGILVHHAGLLHVFAGVTVTGNGTATARHSGLHASDTAEVIINNPGSTPPPATTSFNDNTENGILIDGSAFLGVTGAPGIGGAGTVTANANYAAGLNIVQVAPAGGTLRNCAINGLVTFGTTNGDGMRFFGGSNVTLTNSYSLANSGDGVLVSVLGLGVFMRNNDVTHINLGSVAASAGFGHNVLQASVGSNPNIGSGLCVFLDDGSGMTVNAAGNTFAGPRDCSGTSPGAIMRNTTCLGHTDLGIEPTGMGVGAPPGVTVLNCT